MAKKATKAAKAPIAKKPTVKAKAAPKAAPKSAKAAPKAVKPAKTSKAEPAKTAKVPAKAAAVAKATTPPAKPAPVEAPAKSTKPSLKIVREEAGAVAPSVEKAAEPVTAPVAKAKAEKPVKAKAVKTKIKSSKSAKPATSGEDEARWIDLHEKYRSDKPQVYDMKAIFEAGKPLQHTVLGWGWILSNENDRLEVLFKDGRRMLISNYNPNR